jgi:hypothetical protein
MKWGEWRNFFPRRLSRSAGVISSDAGGLLANRSVDRLVFAFRSWARDGYNQTATNQMRVAVKDTGHASAALAQTLNYCGFHQRASAANG